MTVGNIFCTPGNPDARVAERVLLAVSDERDTWTKRIETAARESYLIGYEEGRRIGYLHGTRDMELTWPAIVRPLAGPTLAELELLRWGPGGRENFGKSVASDRYSFRTGRLAS